jgi:lipoprotein-anchoring transpeptidase ErfK/SrfK
MTRAASAAALAGLAVSLAACGGEVPAKPKPRRPGLAPVPGTGTLTAYVTQAKQLRARPGGRRLVLMKPWTEWRSPRVVTVVRRRGNWLAVLAPELPNNRAGWIDGRRDVKLFRTPWSIVVDLSRRTVTVRHDDRLVLRTLVAVGRPASPTPRGRFAVTDRLTTGSDNGPYGCCVLALTGRQPLIPQGWGGGDRIAIHATPSPETIGQAATTGCLRTTNAIMRGLVRRVPLGTRVYVQD